VTLNGLHHLKPFCESFLPQLSPEWSLVIVDNASTDGTGEFIKGLNYKEIIYIPLSKNAGFAEANNIGASASDSEFVFLINNDTVCDPNLLSVLSKAPGEYPGFDLFACRMVRVSDGAIDNKGIALDKWLRAYQVDSGKEPVEEAASEVFGPSGGAALISRRVISDIGLFATEFFAYQEDVDFALRARLAGYRCLYVPQAVVHHKGGGTSSRMGQFARFHIQRNMEWALARNLTSRMWFRYGLRHVLYSMYQVIRVRTLQEFVTGLRAKAAALVGLRKVSRPSASIRVSSKEFQAFINGMFRGS
jgi:GT2 family glycosyltransferase